MSIFSDIGSKSLHMETEVDNLVGVGLNIESMGFNIPDQ